MENCENVLFRSLIGSRAYGMSTAESDYDVRGVCVASLDTYFGIGVQPYSVFEQYIDTEKDIVIHELRKFLRLAYSGNPTILEILHTPYIIDKTPVGDLLLENKNIFFSKTCVHSYGGYALGQIQKCRNKLAGHENTGIKAKNPYKHAAHCVRILRNGKEVATSGEIRVDRTGIDADELLAIRRGQLDLNEVLFIAEAEKNELDSLLEKSALPYKPDVKVIQELCVSVLSDFYRNKL